MSVLFIVVPLAIGFAAVAVAVFVWATRTGQFDDTKTPGVRILFDDEDVQADPPTNTDESEVQSSST